VNLIVCMECPRSIEYLSHPAVILSIFSVTIIHLQFIFSVSMVRPLFSLSVAIIRAPVLSTFRSDHSEIEVGLVGVDV
jgi:hypothetical protein